MGSAGTMPPATASAGMARSQDRWPEPISAPRWRSTATAGTTSGHRRQACDLIHNVNNMDAIMLIDDVESSSASVSRGRGRQEGARQEDAGRRPGGVLSTRVGISSICNILGAIKTAKYSQDGQDDLVVTVATDGLTVRQRQDDMRRLRCRRVDGGPRAQPVPRPHDRLHLGRPNRARQSEVLHLGRAARPSGTGRPEGSQVVENQQRVYEIDEKLKQYRLHRSVGRKLCILNGVINRQRDERAQANTGIAFPWATPKASMPAHRLFQPRVQRAERRDSLLRDAWGWSFPPPGLAE